jgi:hypothetical protein
MIEIPARKARASGLAEPSWPHAFKAENIADLPSRESCASDLTGAPQPFKPNRQRAEKLRFKDLFASGDC